MRWMRPWFDNKFSCMLLYMNPLSDYFFDEFVVYNETQVNQELWDNRV